MKGFFGGCLFGTLMRIKGIGRGGKDLFAVLIEVIELPAVQRPREHRQDGQHERGRHRDQEVEDVHRRRRFAGLDRPQRASRSELAMTTSELVAMPRPAAHGGKKPSSAKGTQAAL